MVPDLNRLEKHNKWRVFEKSSHRPYKLNLKIWVGVRVQQW